MGRDQAREIAQRRTRTLRMLVLLWRFYWWLPPSGRRQLLGLARRHGPWLVQREYRRRRDR